MSIVCVMAVLLPPVLYLCYTLYFPRVLSPCYFYLSNIVSQCMYTGPPVLSVSAEFDSPSVVTCSRIPCLNPLALKPCIFLIVLISLMSGT